jgi:hypothetical protein
MDWMLEHQGQDKQESSHVLQVSLLTMRYTANCVGAYKQCNSADNSVAFKLQANYTNWVTATDRRILVPNFVNRGSVAWSAQQNPHGH